MKNIFLFTLLIFTLTSCEKTKKHTCHCTHRSIGMFGGECVNTTTLSIQDTKRKAAKECNDMSGGDMWHNIDCTIK